MQNKIVVVLVGFLLVAVFFLGAAWTKIKTLEEGKKAEEKKVAVTPQPTGQAVGTTVYPKTIGNFDVLDKPLCEKDNKPTVYFFGTSGCPHCRWEKPVMEKVMAKFPNLLDFHNNIDTQNDGEVFNAYGNINHGAVPFLLLGCRYARVGSGEQDGETKEEQNLTALLCKLTGGKPDGVCDQIKELIGQIK